MLWALPNGSRVQNPARLASDAQWLSNTSLLGFDRMGIWGHHNTDNSPVITINSVHSIGGYSSNPAVVANPNTVDNRDRRLGPTATSRHLLGGELSGTGGRSGGGLIITAGDRGEIRLLRHPSLVAAAPAREGHSHADRVGCVRFLNEGKNAVSAGVFDRVIVLWEVIDGSRDGRRRD